MQSYCALFFLTLVVVTTFAGDLRCLRPGAPVISLYKDNRYFPGRLDGLGESIDVTFQNGQQQTYASYTNDVIVDDVPDIGELVGGSRVLARRPSSISFEPGFVNGSIEGVPLNDTFLVNYDSGDSIARNIQDIRLAVKPRSCMNEKGIYIGCFENVINNFLTNYYPVNPTDVATCNWACFTRGFRFAGLQNGTWCFCGNHVNDSLKVEDTDCNIACRDSREDVCGGYQRMTVYWTGADYNDNSTNDLSEFTADTTGEGTSSKDMLKSDLTSENTCTDLYDSSQCNTWADQSKCIENPDWMIANCKKSCYACSYNEDKSSSGAQGKALVTSSPSQSNTYQSSVGYQAPSSYPQSPYQTSQDSSAQSSSKKSDHPVLDRTSNTPGYLGCYRDSPTSHDLEYLADIRPLSIRGCVTKCKSMRFPYAGVQSSSSCYCGLHYGKYGQLEHEDCNTPCEADASEMCGGLSKNSLFHTGFPVRFKSVENTLTRKDLSSSSVAQNNVATGGVYPPNPSYNYPPQYPQTSYPQQNLGYTQPVYSQPASSYTQASMPGYSQRPYSQTNGYQPSYLYNNQASNPLQSGSTNAITRDFSPTESSSYRWRETYVKLRQQEQERYSKPSIRNLRKLSKLPGSTWPKLPENSVKRKYPMDDKTDSVKFQNPGNNAATVQETKESSTKSTSSVPKSLYKQSMSAHNKKIPHKSRKLRQEKFGKPGVFLRKKTSKKNSFLAFLPNEVTKDESLLENVYSMLSVMLKNLKKHRKSSLKNLRKYLKFSPSDEEGSRITGKTSLHVSDHTRSVDSSKKPEKHKFQGVGARKSHKQGRKLEDSASSQYREVAKNNRSEGQKQLSKPDEISTPKIQAISYPQHGDLSMRQDVNSPLEATNGNSGYKHSANNEVKPAVIHAQSLFTTVAPTYNNDVGRTSQSKPRKNLSGNTVQAHTKWPFQGHLSLSKDKYDTKVRGKSTSTAEKVLEHPANASRIQKTISTFKHEKHGRSFENILSEKDASPHQENRREKITTETKDANESLKKLVSGKESGSSKTGDKDEFKLDKETAFKARNKTIENDTVEKSDDEIISTIVDMLDKEKLMRNNTKDDQRKQNDVKTKQRKNAVRRKIKTHRKRSKFTKRKHQRKSKVRTGKHDKMNATKRLYKKDHLGRVLTDDNLMTEDEDYRESNGMTDE